MNELIMPHNAGVKRVLESMKEVLALYKNVTGIWVTNKKPNSFTNPPNFAFPSFSYYLVLPSFAFISGRIALIFQNPLFFTTFFCNFQIKRKKTPCDSVNLCENKNGLRVSPSPHALRAEGPRGPSSWASRSEQTPQEVREDPLTRPKGTPKWYFGTWYFGTFWCFLNAQTDRIVIYNVNIIYKY